LIWPKHFKKGPFDLGIFSRFCASIACLWCGFITVVFCLPETNPVTVSSFNYTPVAVGIVAVWTFGLWFLSARKWFTGPIRQIQAEQAGIDLMEEAEVERKLEATIQEPEVTEA